MTNIIKEYVDAAEAEAKAMARSKGLLDTIDFDFVVYYLGTDFIVTLEQLNLSSAQLEILKQRIDYHNKTTSEIKSGE